MFLSFFWNISYLILIYLYACIFLVFFFWPFLCLVRFLCCLFFMSVNILKEYQYNAHTHTHQHMCVVFSFCFPSVMSICATNILNARPDSIYVPLIFWKRKKGKTYTKNWGGKKEKRKSEHATQYELLIAGVLRRLGIYRPIYVNQTGENCRSWRPLVMLMAQLIGPLPAEWLAYNDLDHAHLAAMIWSAADCWKEPISTELWLT